MGKAVARKAKTKAQTLAEAQRALELHVAGVEDVVICQELGISRATLYRRMQWARSIVLDPLVEEYRQNAYARIRESRRRIYEQLNATRPVVGLDGLTVLDRLTGQTLMEPVCGPAEVASLTGQLVRLEDVEAKLRGGYAPTQVNVQHTVRDAFATLMDELAANDPRPAETQETSA
jgi:hypothetical protein